MLSENYQWYVKADLKRYKGKYVLIRRGKVEFYGNNLKELVAKFKQKYPGEVPFIVKVPEDEVLVL